MYSDSVRFAISAKYTNDLGASPKMRVSTPIEVEEHRGDTQKEEHRGYPHIPKLKVVKRKIQCCDSDLSRSDRKGSNASS